MDIGKQKGYKRPMTLKKTIEQHKYTRWTRLMGLLMRIHCFTVGSIPQDTPILCISSPGEAGRMH